MDEYEDELVGRRVGDVLRDYGEPGRPFPMPRKRRRRSPLPGSIVALAGAAAALAFGMAAPAWARPLLALAFLAGAGAAVWLNLRAARPLRRARSRPQHREEPAGQRSAA